MTEEIVHIVPTVPPAFNGLSDYCHKLWQHWPAPRPPWHALAAQVPQGAREIWPQAQISEFALSKSGLFKALEQTASRRIVLHYVGYAYQKKGVPLWLPSALRAYKKRRGARICVMFHELYATGTPRQSAYWLQPLTKSIASQLARLADSWIVSCEAAAYRLVNGVGADAARGHIVPVGPNIEPQVPILWEKPWPLARGEQLRVAIFGLPSNRAAALRVHGQLLQLLMEADLLENVALIGKAGDPNENQTQTELREGIAPHWKGWSEHPDLPPAEISRILAHSHAGLTHYTPDLLTKSGVYPAFCAHGVVTVCHRQRPLPAFEKQLGFAIPHLPNDDAHASDTVRALCDDAVIAPLRDATRAIADNQLNWQSIVRSWQRIVAL